MPVIGKAETQSLIGPFSNQFTKRPPVSNPFFYGGRITNPAHFVGRTKELREIFSALETAHSGQLQHVQVVGPRRIGKSSLLYQVAQTYPQRLAQPEKYRFVYVDLDDARCHTLPGLLNFILAQLKVSARPTLADFEEAIERLNRVQGIYPVICLDEFEHLTSRKEQFPNEVFEAWRSLANASKMAFITASKTPLGKLLQQSDLTSTFHNIFIYLELGEFTEAEAEALLARSTDRPFSESETAALFTLAGHHPAQLQMAAQLLYEARANPPVNWSALKADYKKRLAQVQPVRPPGNQPPLARRILFVFFIAFPTAPGRFVLDLLKNKDASDRTAAILGWVILALLLLILLGFISVSEILPWLKLLL